MMSMMPVGMLAGAILVIAGANDISREIKPQSGGMVADSVMDIAQFMGFRRESGLGVDEGINLAASVTTVFGTIRKPDAWKRFRWLPLDFYRTVDGMNRA